MALHLHKNNVTITVKSAPLQFRKNDDETWHTAPIHWKPAKSTDTLTITWVFDAGITGVTTTSKHITVNGNVWTITQKTTKQDDDHFTVQYQGGGSEDPKIVITPQ